MKIIKILSLMLFFVSMGMISSCSKESEEEENVLTQYYGRWETEDVLFDYSYESNIYGEIGQPDVQISNWKTKTNVPHFVLLQENGKFTMRIKNRTIYGDWTGGACSGLYKGEIDLTYDYQGNVCSGRMLAVLSVNEQTMIVETPAIVDSGVFPEYEGETSPLATVTFKKM